MIIFRSVVIIRRCLLRDRIASVGEPTQKYLESYAGFLDERTNKRKNKFDERHIYVYVYVTIKVLILVNVYIDYKDYYSKYYIYFHRVNP